MRDLILKIVQTSGAKIYSLLLGMVTLAITARWLGPDGRGIVASVTTWVNMFVFVTSISLSLVVIYQATEGRGKKWLSKMLGAMTLHTLIVTLLSWFVVVILYVAGHYWGFVNVFGDIPAMALLIGCLIMPFSLWELYSQSLLNVENRLFVFNKFQVVGSTVNSILVAITVIVSGFGVLGVLISKLVWQGIIAIGGIKDLLKHSSHPVTLKLGSYTATYKTMLTDGLKLHLNILGTVMLTNVDILMVSAYLGNAETGIYQLAVQFTEMMLIVSYAVMTVLQGEASRKGVHDVWPYQRRLIFLTVAFLMAAAFFMGYTAKWWLIWLAGEEFRASVDVFRYLVISVIATTLQAIMISVQWIARGWFLQLSMISIVLGIMNITLNAILIPKFGLLGAVWATLATSALSLVINITAFIYVELDVRKHQRLVAKQEQSL